jgi:Dolichyl-phosphate-mannose-protein mannosyltransferase
VPYAGPVLTAESPTEANGEASEPTAPTGLRGLRASVEGWVRWVAPAVGIYLGLRIISLATFVGLSKYHHTKVGPVGLLRSWDGWWYLRIAQSGYGHAYQSSFGNRPPYDGKAFFPLYPFLMRAVHTVTPLGLSGAGLLITFVSALFAAAGIFAVGEHLFDRRVGILAAALWAVVPHAIVESMVYSEALFTALASWALYATLRRQWLLAGVLTCVCGLTRPTAAALIAAVGLAALVAVVRRQDGWRPWLAIVLSPLGLLAYVGWVGYEKGSPTGYFTVQKEAWTMHFDGGAYTFRRMLYVLGGKNDPHDVVYPPSVDLQRTGFVVATLLLIAILLLLVLQYVRRDPLPLLVFATVSILTVYGSASYYASKPRHLLPVFTLLFPLAALLAKARNRSLTLGFVTLAGVSGWYAAYLLVFYGWVAL